MKAVVSYLRVSTEGQADRGLGLDVQREQISEHAQQNEMRVVEEFADVTSGSNGLDQRSGLAGALEALALGEAEAILVARYDRLARDLVQQEMILREVASADGEVISAASGEANLSDDESDPSRKMIRQILGAVAEYERELIVARMKRGRMAKAARGGFATGSPPYGWRAQDRELVEHPTEQAILADIRTLRGAGDSYRAIANYLNAAKLPTKRGFPHRWHPAQVKRALENDAKVRERKGESVERR